MKKFRYFFQLAWLRLFTGDTPLFFKYWGVFLTFLNAISAYLVAQVTIAPDPVKEKYQVMIWVFQVIVGIISIMTANMTTRNKDISTDNFKEAVKVIKASKKKTHEQEHTY